MEYNKTIFVKDYKQLTINYFKKRGIWDDIVSKLNVSIDDAFNSNLFYFLESVISDSFTYWDDFWNNENFLFKNFIIDRLLLGVKYYVSSTPTTDIINVFYSPAVPVELIKVNFTISLNKDLVF